MSAHVGRCFRALRRTKLRYARRGGKYNALPIRQKIPAALRPFMNLVGVNHRRATAKDMSIAVGRFAMHQMKVAAQKQQRTQGRGG